MLSVMVLVLLFGENPQAVAYSAQSLRHDCPCLFVLFFEENPHTVAGLVLLFGENPQAVA